MAIVKMSKFTLFTLQDYKEKLLKEIQKFEGVQLVDLQNQNEEEELNLQNAAENSELTECEQELADIKFCLNLLEEYTEKGKALDALKKGKTKLSYKEIEEKAKSFEWKNIYSSLREKEEKLNSLKNERTKLKGEIEQLEAWIKLDIGLKDYRNINKCVVNVGTLPKANYDNLLSQLKEKLSYYYVEAINEEINDINVVIVYHKENEVEAQEVIKDNNFTKINFAYEDNPRETIAKFKKRISEIDKEEEQTIKAIKEYSSKVEMLQVQYEYFSNKIMRLKSYNNVLKSEKVIAMEGWVSAENASSFERIVKKVCGENYYTELKEAADEEDIPIELKGNGFTEPFQSITEMYSLPNYREVDPTPIYSLFYVLFFGMMLSDAAYGLLLTIGTIIATKAFNLEKGQKNFLRLFTYLGISTTIWGIIYGSFFGDLLSKYLDIEFFQNPLLNPQADIMTIMVMSIAFGVIHVYIGLGVKAYVLIRDGKVKDAIYDVFTWYAAVSGLLIWLAGSSIGIDPNIGKYLAIVGLVGLVLTQGRDAKSIGGKIGGGVYGLYGITGYVGDLISYSRLLALGLATGFISNAFNLMINLFPTPIKFTLGVVLFVGLHMFNLGINALGAYVHTSRLQYLEFFNKFYEGGGKKFTPLKSESKYINVSDQ